jgi:hypothetical protein
LRVDLEDLELPDLLITTRALETKTRIDTLLAAA